MAKSLLTGSLAGHDLRQGAWLMPGALVVQSLSNKDCVPGETRAVRISVPTAGNLRPDQLPESANVET